MVAFNQLAEFNGGSDILKSFFARQLKKLECKNNSFLQRTKTPFDEILTISFPETDSIRELQELVKEQTTLLEGEDQWQYDDINKCDAMETTKYQFYDYVLIQLKIFNNDGIKRKVL